MALWHFMLSQLIECYRTRVNAFFMATLYAYEREIQTIRPVVWHNIGRNSLANSCKQMYVDRAQQGFQYQLHNERIYWNGCRFSI